MLNINQYQLIKEVRDSSPFTKDIPLNRYINDVRWRLGQWYGIHEELITDEDVWKFLKICKEKIQ